ncbi:MAG: hypothetical protein E7077_13340 [Bacteroidales bacterium]|jgi:hypothetical protein|nr:hypothetical protein [Bacteroidales bacterium]
MEKFSFLKLAKISFLILGLFSLTFTSCRSDDDDPKTSPFDGLPGVPVLEVGDFYVPYPENHSFRSYNLNDVTILVGDYKTGHNDKFKCYLTMDTLSESVRILYYSLIDPTTVDASDVDGLAKTFVNDWYSDDNGYEQTTEETVLFAGFNAKKITSMQVWVKDPSTNEKIEGRFYHERYIFFDSGSKKVYSVVMQMPESLMERRRPELYNILSGLKVNKK